MGQRKGLGVALGEPKFVVEIQGESNRVVLGDRAGLDARGGSRYHEEPPQSQRCHAQIRYNATAAPATMQLLPDDRLHIIFDEPQFGVAPGQAVVCYDGQQNRRVLGGGWIE